MALCLIPLFYSPWCSVIYCAALQLLAQLCSALALIQTLIELENACQAVEMRPEGSPVNDDCAVSEMKTYFSDWCYL